MVAEQREMLSKILLCLSSLEEKVAQAYQALAEGAESPLAKAILIFISKDSFKHAAVLQALGSAIAHKTEIDFNECSSLIGEQWSEIVREAEEIMQSRSLTSSTMKKLEALEGFAGEEYYTIIELEALEMLAREAKLDLSKVKMLLDWIAEDERRHEQLLKMLRELV